MAYEPTKNPAFATDAEIKSENNRRRMAIEQFQKMSVEQIILATATALASDVGRAMTPAAGELLYVRKSWLIRPQDKKEHDKLIYERATSIQIGIVPTYPLKDPMAKWKEIDAKLDAIYRRGSDHLRAAVGRAAAWACVPAEMLAAVLQNENSPKADGWDRAGQAAERSLQALIGKGSTGFGNVKPETLADVTQMFKFFYHRSILGPGVKDEDQNDNAETDIFHAAVVLRDGLNKAWSAGGRSLNPEQFKKYEYYPYFGGTVTADDAVRAMGHYNGMGDAAKTYGEMGLKRIKSQPLHFLPPK
jgi:hypothetical protein